MFMLYSSKEPKLCLSIIYVAIQWSSESEPVRPLTSHQARQTLGADAKRMRQQQQTNRDRYGPKRRVMCDLHQQTNNFSTAVDNLHGVPRNDITVSTLTLPHHCNSEFNASQTQLQLLDEKRL